RVSCRRGAIGASVVPAFRELAALAAPRGEVPLDDLALGASEPQAFAGQVDDLELATVARLRTQQLAGRSVEIMAQSAQIAVGARVRRDRAAGGGRARARGGRPRDRLTALGDGAAARLEVPGELLRVTHRAREVGSPGLLVARPSVAQGLKPVPRLHAVDVTL